MKIIIENTSKIVTFEGLPARIWEGYTESGIKIHCYITRVAVHQDEPRQQEFERELMERRKPSAEVEAIPLRMIL